MVIILSSLSFAHYLSLNDGNRLLIQLLLSIRENLELVKITKFIILKTDALYGAPKQQQQNILKAVRQNTLYYSGLAAHSRISLALSEESVVQ